MYDTDGCSIGCLFILLLFLFIGFNSFSERHDFYELKKIKLFLYNTLFKQKMVYS